MKNNAYLCTRKTKNVAPVAQLVEHLTLNQGVQGSSPCGCTKKCKIAGLMVCFSCIYAHITVLILLVVVMSFCFDD